MCKCFQAIIKSKNKHYMKTIILLLSLLMPQLVAASSKYDLERALNNLDQTIEKRNVYLQSKEAQISKAKRELAMTEFNADRYIHYKRLYNSIKNMMATQPSTMRSDAMK